MTERESFIAALHADSSESRAAILDRACAGNSTLRARIEALLSEQQKLGTFMDVNLAESCNNPSVSGKVGDLIGPYRLLQPLGEGGMGIVFLAEQLRPVLRKVAIKVIKAGMDTRQVVVRFEAERQTLALMDHANIARVLDAGATEHGRPFFVMELVHGVPITQYCDDHALTIRDRLGLFILVCQAIQHAHQKGIIHRDIKPSNVMVTEIDGRPVPKVIDFGVAKAMAHSNTHTNAFTQIGTMIGTLQYMSPEQAGASVSGIDTRSDIFALGIMLYELLTGTTPLLVQTMSDVAYPEVLRQIREVDPPKPSSRLSELADTDINVLLRRSSERKRLIRQIRGELDWVVLKSLEKDRNRRYETASGLAADLIRYLADDPVQACPPSSWYRFRKFARRNRVVISGLVCLSSVVLLAVVLLALSNSSIRHEQTRTQAEKVRAERLQRLAEKHAQEVRLGLENLKNATTSLDQGRRYSTERHWDDAYASFTNAITVRPDHASAWQERGDLMASLGLFDLANADFAREFELREPEGTTRWYRHALLSLALGDSQRYRHLVRRMHERFQRTIQRDFAVELVRSTVLTADPDYDYRPLVKAAEHALASEQASWYLMYILGVAHLRNGDYGLAVEQLRASQTGGPSGPNQAMSFSALALAYHALGRTLEARQALDTAAATIEQWREERYQARDPHTWVIHQGAVAHWPVAWWDWLECEVYYREATLTIDGTMLNDDGRLHVLRARSFAGLRKHRTAAKEYAAALELLPNDSTIRMELHRCAAYCALDKQRWSDTAREFASAMELAPHDADLWHFLAVAHLAAGDFPAYQQVCEDMLDRFENTTDWRVAGNVVLTCVVADQAVSEPDRLMTLAERAAAWPHVGAYVLGASQFRAGQYAKAIRCFEEAAKLYHPQALEMGFLAMAHHRIGNVAAARVHLADATKWFATAEREIVHDEQQTAAAFGGWHERIVFRALLQEANNLINGRGERAVPQ